MHRLFYSPMAVQSDLLGDREHIAELRRLALAERERDGRGAVRSAVGAWQSRTIVHQWDSAPIHALRAGLHRIATELTIAETGNRARPEEIIDSAAVNVVSNGDCHAPHTHRNFTWSAVYYVAVEGGDEKDPYSGVLEFLDPRANALLLGIDRGKRKARIAPKEDLAVVFPSWLEHWVRPWRGDGLRIAIAWNMLVRDVSQREEPRE